MAILNNQMVFVDFFIYFFISGVKSVLLCKYICHTDPHRFLLLFKGSPEPPWTFRPFDALQYSLTAVNSGNSAASRAQPRKKQGNHGKPTNLPWSFHMAVCQNLVPLVNIKIAGKWMFIPLKMVLIGIDPYPYLSIGSWTKHCVWLCGIVWVCLKMRYLQILTLMELSLITIFPMRTSNLDTLAMLQPGPPTLQIHPDTPFKNTQPSWEPDTCSPGLKALAGRPAVVHK